MMVVAQGELLTFVKGQLFSTTHDETIARQSSIDFSLGPYGFIIDFEATGLDHAI